MPLEVSRLNLQEAAVPADKMLQQTASCSTQVHLKASLTTVVQCRRRVMQSICLLAQRSLLLRIYSVAIRQAPLRLKTVCSLSATIPIPIGKSVRQEFGCCRVANLLFSMRCCMLVTFRLRTFRHSIIQRTSSFSIRCSATTSVLAITCRQQRMFTEESHLILRQRQHQRRALRQQTMM